MTFNLCDYIPLAQASFSLRLHFLLLHFLHFVVVLVSFSTTRIKPIFIHCIFAASRFLPSCTLNFSRRFIDVLYILFEYFKLYTTTKHSTPKCNFSTGKGVLLHLWLYMCVWVDMLLPLWIESFAYIHWVRAIYFHFMLFLVDIQCFIYECGVKKQPINSWRRRQQSYFAYISNILQFGGRWFWELHRYNVCPDFRRVVPSFICIAFCKSKREIKHSHKYMCNTFPFSQLDCAALHGSERISKQRKRKKSFIYHSIAIERNEV